MDGGEESECIEWKAYRTSRRMTLTSIKSFSLQRATRISISSRSFQIRPLNSNKPPFSSIHSSIRFSSSRRPTNVSPSLPLPYPTLDQTSRTMATSSDQTNLPVQDYGNFKLLQSFPLEYAPVTVSKWRSEKTGLTVVLGSHSCELFFSTPWQVDMN